MLLVVPDILVSLSQLFSPPFNDHIGRHVDCESCRLPFLVLICHSPPFRILLLRAKVLPTERKRLQEQSRVVRECLAASEPFDENGTHITRSLKTLDYWVC
jgi:hypothetical protein